MKTVYCYLKKGSVPGSGPASMIFYHVTRTTKNAAGGLTIAQASGGVVSIPPEYRIVIREKEEKRSCC